MAMFKHLLLPLDGTATAERVIPVARGLVKDSDARITLLHVIERSAPKARHGQAHLQDQDSAEAYLRALIAREFPDRPGVDWHVHDEATRNVADGLALHAQELQPDLVVMCAHGSQWWKDRFRGNLAQQLLHALKHQSPSKTPVPVLLVQPDERGQVDYPFHHILVPMDGADEHEQGLRPAAQLALQLKIPMLLFTAIPPSDALKGKDSATAALLPRATEEVLRLAEQEAARHLTVHVRELQEMGVSVLGRVMRADPAEGVLATAREMHSDLIVIGTHALSATQAFWSASMTPKVLHQAHASFLLASGESEA
ncbi:MAG TPA: universal stress protein [Polyangia bacterium]|jgi:Universal stress protein UspA and related nucleotide-binding proteins|nr:universal stress protein [Polyangia bacterium]